ncbi:Hypothetical protein A7982_10196 [Minicystis rosea]|nr:Hypothetical protein A7982_10196 [Minicystis rosea]
MLSAGLTASCWENSMPPLGMTGGSGGGGGSTTTSGGSGGGGPVLPVALKATTTSTRFQTADVMFASIEMQVSGEPFAELLGRDIGLYDRFSDKTDNYLDPQTGNPTTDPLGFSLAVESYEYSKQTMNTLSFESGAGLSLQYGSILNPTGQTGDAAYALLGDRLQYLAKASRATGAKLGKDFVTSPLPVGDPTNYYGWPGFWPVFAEFRSFDTAVAPKVGADLQCSLAGAIDEPLPPGTVITYVGDYECDANSLGLSNREAQVEKVLAPDALAFAAWKQTLWAINYWAAMHDVDQRAIVVVPEAALPLVGVPDNKVVGQWESPIDPDKLLFGKDGVFFGGVSLEGWQGLVMIEEIDNKSALLLRGLTTADGAALGGVSSIAAADDYDYTSPLRWWPAAVAVTETATAPTSDETRKYFPKPTAFTVMDGQSRLQDLSALVGAFGTVFAMTDENNPEVGGLQQFRAAFDGTPWASDNGMPDGEDSLHDRALGIVKMALVNMDRIHFDATNKVIVDAAAPQGGTVKRGTAVTTVHASHAIVGMRTALRALDASLALYSNDTPDTHGLPSALDTTKLGGATFSGTIAGRARELIAMQADFIADKLLDEKGLAHNGFDLAAGTPDASPTTLEAQAAAIRGLLEAYLATSDEHYRQRATDAFQALEQTFWMVDARMYRTTAGESAKMTYTPKTFGTLHGALRQYYKLVASRPGKEEEGKLVLDRVLRGMKLIVNGWNDMNGDAVVQPEECLEGRLQMAERALTGEFSIASDNGDRDHDCVPDIATAKLPAGLAGEVVFERK